MGHPPVGTVDNDRVLVVPSSDCMEVPDYTFVSVDGIRYLEKERQG